MTIKESYKITSLILLGVILLRATINFTARESRENNLEFDLRGLIVNYLESFLDYKFVLLRLKINLSLPIDRSSEYDWHWDQEEHKDTDVHKKMISGVIYLNTNDGGTEFRDKELGIINSNENTGILFPSSLEHRGVNQTNTPTRYVINYNILPWK